MRDDLYPLTPAERAAALAGWRRIPVADRYEAGRLAGKGLPAPRPAVAAAARRYGECLLERNLTNRLPRSALVTLGLLVLASGILLAGDPVTGGLGWGLVAGGVTGTALGLLSWGLRRAGRSLVRANSPASPPG